MWVFIPLYIITIGCFIFEVIDCIILYSIYSSADPSSSGSGHSSTRGGESGNESDDEELEDDDEQSSPVKEGENNEDEDFQKLIQTLQDVIDDNSKSATVCVMTN